MPLIGQNLTGEFMRKIYTASWIIFVSTCDVFNSLFPLDVQNEIQLLSGVVCYSWLVGFWLRITSLVKVGNPISDGILFLFHLASYVRVKKSEAILALLWYFSGVASRIVSLSNYCTWCLFFRSNLMKSSLVYAVFSLCTFVRFATMIWPRISFDISLQNFKKL